MWDIHRTSATWLVRRAARAPASRPRHRDHSRRRLTLEPLEERALLSTWTVNSLGDSGSGSGQSGDLRYVITQANQTTGDNTINFSVTGTITLNSALPDLSNTTGLMDIEGPGAASLTVARNSAAGTRGFSVFRADSGADARLVGLTVTGGGAQFGGGIYNAGTLAVTECTVTANVSTGGYVTGVYVAVGGGGGIYNDDGGALTVTNSVIANNGAQGVDDLGNLTSEGGGNAAGGGISVFGGVVHLVGDTFSGNWARGGAVDTGPLPDEWYQAPGPGHGDQVWYVGQYEYVQEVRFNVAGQWDGWPVGPGGDAYGGGLAVLGGAVYLAGNTFEGNTATGGPGNPGYPTPTGEKIETLVYDTSLPGWPLVSDTIDYIGFGVLPSRNGSGYGDDVFGPVIYQAAIANAVTVGWGSQTTTLQTASDGLRLLPAGRNTDMPWLGINQVQINLSQAAALTAGDITVTGIKVADYGPVTVTGSGTSYIITLNQAINRADRVTITIGNDQIASFTRRLDVLPGDLNDDGVVNAQDMVDARNQILGIGTIPALFGDINGDGKVDINDYTAVRQRIGTHL